jgi:ABC-type Fe3+/spermidine/putrescine transport system ATPase subunit
MAVDAASETPVLRLVEVTKRFGAIAAVEGVSLDVRRGEVLTLLGPSGCGKTTTLRMVIGLERCDEGEIVYNDRVVDSPRRAKFEPTHKREMGMVFQSYAIWPHMSVFENVAFPLRVRGVGGGHLSEAVHNALELVDLAGFAPRPATQLSGGQQQRVALARSLVFEPKILLLDEPFSNLDAHLRDAMRAELRRLQRRLGITVLLVTHDQVEALSVSDRIAVMRAGRVEQVGPPHEIYDSPVSAAVRDFVGRAVVLEGAVTEVGEAETAVTLIGGGRVICRGTLREPLRVGDRCQVGLRPEHIHIGGPDETDRPNSLAGRIAALLFVGDRYEARIALDLGQEVFAYLSAADHWQEEQRLTLRLRPEDLRLWHGLSVTP